MIRIHSLAFRAGQNQLAMQIGWWDPEEKMFRTRMAMMLTESLRDFEKVCKQLKAGEGFTVEYMCKFLRNRKELGDNVVKIMCADASTGVGCEWNADPLITTSVDTTLPPVDWAAYLRTLTDEQLAEKSGHAARNDHRDVLDMINAEVDRRKV